MITKNIVEEYIKSHPGSGKLHRRGEKIFSANGATHSARLLDPFRPYFTHAKGSRKWDVDGNEYIDYSMGHGSLILGHCHPNVVKAVQEQAARGFHYGEEHELAIEWAELIKTMMPATERVEFFACGQEANMMAVRLARVFTDRVKVLRFQYNYHGWADGLVALSTPGTTSGEATEIPMHDLNRLEAALATEEYAIVMTEGGGAIMGGHIPWDTEFIRILSGLARKYNTIWHIDEVVTGFRDAPGGWQSTIGVTPDLTSLGKAVSGGISIGALVGRQNILDGFKPKAPPQPFISHHGTWNANPIVSSTGVAACKLYLNGEPQNKARQRGAYLREKGNQVLKERGISGRLYGRTIIHLYLGPIDHEPSDDTLPPTKNNVETELAIKKTLCLHLLQHGVATMGGRFFVMSAAHTEKDIDQTVEAFGSALDGMLAEGTILREKESKPSRIQLK